MTSIPTPVVGAKKISVGISDGGGCGHVNGIEQDRTQCIFCKELLFVLVKIDVVVSFNFSASLYLHESQVVLLKFALLAQQFHLG